MQTNSRNSVRFIIALPKFQNHIVVDIVSNSVNYISWKQGEIEQKSDIAYHKLNLSFTFDTMDTMGKFILA